jgi:hypothetical protein
MKTCESCGASVPDSANLCKHCFHDFDEQGPKAPSNASTLILGALAAMSVVAALTITVVTGYPLDEEILVKQDTRSIVFAKLYRSGKETEVIKWDDIVRLEYVVSSGGSHEIRAVTTSGESTPFHTSKGSLKNEAQRYKKLMDKPLTMVDNSPGSHLKSRNGQ